MNLQDAIASLRSRWSKLASMVAAGLSGALIFAAASALVDVRSLLKDLFASPEKQLTELGYGKRTYDEFVRAIDTRHVEAIELFGKLHIRVKPEHFFLLFEDEKFASPVLDALLAAKSVDEALCPTDLKGSHLYTTHATNPEKLRYLREICAKPSVLATLKATKAAELSRLQAAGMENANRANVLEGCTRKYLTENYQALLDEASHFSIVSRTTYTERECVLAEINTRLLLGGNELARGPAAIAPFVGSCCQRYNRAASDDRRPLGAVEAALTLLGAS